MVTAKEILAVDPVDLLDTLAEDIRKPLLEAFRKTLYHSKYNSYRENAADINAHAVDMLNDSLYMYVGVAAVDVPVAVDWGGMPASELDYPHIAKALTAFYTQIAANYLSPDRCWERPSFQFKQLLLT